MAVDRAWVQRNLGKGESVGRRRICNWVEAEVALNPCAVDSHDPLPHLIICETTPLKL